MEEETTELASVEQQLAILQKRLPQDMAVLDSFAGVQTSFAELVQQITDWQAKANDTLKNLESVSGNWGQRLAELEEYAQNSKREEFGTQLGDVNSRLENVEYELRDKFNRKSNDQNLNETKLRDFLEDNESYKKMVSDRFERLEAKREREIDDLRRLYKQALTEGQSEFSQLITELEQFKQEQVQLQDQVSQLQNQLSQLQQFQQGTIDKPQQTVNQRVAEINKTNTDSSVKQPIVCTHIENPQGNLFCIHCDQPIKVQRTIRQYQVLQTLEQGEMENIYIVCEKSVMKAIQPQLLLLKEMNADMEQVSKSKELFEQTAHTLKALNHPGIPKFFDFFIDNDKKYLVRERLFGRNLEKRIHQQGSAVFQQAIGWMLQLCEVLDYIHNQDSPLIHGNIQPANLLVRNEDNRVFVLDFRAVKEMGMPNSTRIKADDYTAPEQERGQQLTQSDIYSISLTLIFLLTGESPQKFWGRRGWSYQFHLEGVPTITPQLRTVISRATEPEPSDRYQTVKELAQALVTCL